MLLRTSILALAMFSGAALAGESLDQTLTTKDGMSQVSDGLYAKKNGLDESYVAVNDAGRTKLLAIVQRTRASLEKAYSADGVSRTEEISLADLDRTIKELSRPMGPATQSSQQHTANCGATTILARASSTGGTTASAYSVASNANGPVDATTNFASTTLGFSYQATNTTGATPASVSNSNPTVCNATAFADVTCPGNSDPSVFAFAISYRPGSLSCFLH